MIAGLRRPRTLFLGAAVAWLMAVGIAISAANVVPISHAGVTQARLPELLLPATLRIEPGTLNLASAGGDGTVSVFLTLPGPHQAAEIVPSSVELCFAQRCASGDGRWNLAGNSTLQVKFARAALHNILSGESGGVTLDADGLLSTAPGRFQGSTMVLVLG
jgi:hypothetical protein